MTEPKGTRHHEPGEAAAGRRGWPERAARLVVGAGAVGAAVSAGCAGVGAAFGRGDPHGGGLWWVIGLQLLPFAAAVLAAGLAALVLVRVLGARFLAARDVRAERL